MPSADGRTRFIARKNLLTKCRDWQLLDERPAQSSADTARFPVAMMGSLYAGSKGILESADPRQSRQTRFFVGF